MARVAQRDRRAIALLFERHQLRVYHFVLRLVANSATAEDIVSEVFFELWRHAARFEGRARLSTWLLAIARNKAVSAMRGRIERRRSKRPWRKPSRIKRSRPKRLWMQPSGACCCVDASRSYRPAHREIIDLVYYHEKNGRGGRDHCRRPWSHR